MGWHATVLDQDLTFKQDTDYEAAAEEVRKVLKAYTPNDPYYTTVEFKALTLEELLEDVFVSFDLDRTSGAADINAMGNNDQRWQVQPEILSALAPFIEQGSYLELEFGDGSYVLLRFNGEHLTERQGRIEYD